MKKIITILCICFLSVLSSQTEAKSVEQKKNELNVLSEKKSIVERLVAESQILGEIDVKVVSYGSEIEPCTVTIQVYGPLGEPYGTYTGTSWISCDLALRYAIDQMIQTLFP